MGVYIYIERERERERGEIRGDLLWELAVMIMEAEKSQDLLSASWRPRKACSVIQSESKGLRRGWGQWCNLNPSLRPENQE